MKENQTLITRLEQYLSGKIGYHILRTSLQRCSADLNEFVKEKREFSDEQLFGIVAFCDHIKNQLGVLNQELASRLLIFGSLLSHRWTCCLCLFFTMIPSRCFGALTKPLMSLSQIPHQNSFKFL